MSNVSPILDPLFVTRTLLAYRWRWIVPTIVVFTAAVGYSVMKPKAWEAAQGLMLRDEAIGTLRAGRFADADAMKNAQQTVSEIVRSEIVVREALEQIGPPANLWFTNGYPSTDDVEKLRGRISVRAPNGAEFGKTEVFYLRVSDGNRDRAVALAAGLCDRLEAQLGGLRRRKAESLMAENQRTVQLAREDLETVTERLSAIEKEVGSDLAELRVLSQPSGEGGLRTTLVAAKNDLRQLELVKQSKQELLQTLKQAESDTNQIVATPNELLESQPALKRLKDGLIDAQLQTSQLLAQMEAEHPRVQAALEGQHEIRERLHGELAAAVRGLQTEIDTNRVRIESLERQIGEMNGRLGKLAQLRAEYSNLAIAVDRRNEILKKAEESLADARASASAAQSVNLLTRIDAPATGNNPVGPRRSTIAAAGLFGGLFAGLGIVFLTVPLVPRNTVQPEGIGATANVPTAEPAPSAERGPCRPCASTFVPEETDDEESQPSENQASAAPHSNLVVTAFDSKSTAPPAMVVETVELGSANVSEVVEVVSAPVNLVAPAAEATPVTNETDEQVSETVPSPVPQAEVNDPWGQAAANAVAPARGGFSEADLQPVVKTAAAPTAALASNDSAKPGTLLGGALARLFAQTTTSRE